MNFKTPISTTHEQSERLLALGVKPETADMYIDEHGIPVCFPYSRLDGHQDQPFLHPAWSLSRLLEMIPSFCDNYLLSGNMPLRTIYANPRTLTVVVAKRVITTSAGKLIKSNP